RLGEYLPGQDGHRRKARQQHTALDGCVAGPVADLIAVGLDPHRDHRQQRDQYRCQDRVLAPLGLRPVVRRRLSQLRLRTDGVDLRDLLRRLLRFRRGVELLRLHQALPGEQAPPGPQQGLLSLLFHHRVHGAAHHILQRDGVGRGRQILPQLLQQVLRLGGRLLGRSCFFRHLGGGTRPRLRLQRRLLRAALRRRGGRLRLPAGLLLHGLHKPLLPACAVFRQDLLQGEVLLQRRDIRAPGQTAIKLSLVFGSHAAPFLSAVSPALQAIRWRTASYSRIAAAAEAFREFSFPRMGILTKKSQFSAARRVMPS
ncbi:putative amino-acid metabolite efflux pump, partial [Dysosmobacter welbionis]